MSVGPFLSYAPPGVYTRTVNEATTTALVAGLRIPALIGVGQEELEQNDFEIVRGSSSTVDQQIVNEDVTASWIVDATNPNNPIFGTQDGTLTTVRIRNYPIVDGQGYGRTTNDIRSLSVTVNGQAVALGSVQGAKGLVTLQVPTQPTDVVRVTYFFHRGDTSFTDDVSAQVTSANAVLTSPAYGPFEITSGLNDSLQLVVGGVLTTITLPGGSVSTGSLVTAINAAQVTNLSASSSADNDGKEHLVLTAPTSVAVGSGTVNGTLGFSAGASTSRNVSFRVFQRPIVDGTGGGLITTDTSKVVVKVNGTQVVPAAVNGSTGTVVLPSAPAPGATVTVQYWSNTWQDTFDYLPNTLVTNVVRCGIASGRSDFIQGTDFVVSNPSRDVSVINWGASYQVGATSTTAGATPFDGATGSGGQISGTLIDDRLYLGACTRVVDTTTIPATVSSTDFLLPEVPTVGNGRNTTLGTSTFNSVTNSRQGVVSNRPDLVQVYTGHSLRDALNRAPVEVITVDGDSRRVKLKTPQPPDYKAYASFYYSRLVDDTYVITNKVGGAAGVGQYGITSATRGTNLHQVKFGTKTSLPEIVQWPRGAETIPDAFHTGAGTPVSETVTVTFGQGDPANAAFVVRGQAPYSFYDASKNWITTVNGTDAATNLSSPSPAVLVGSRVTLDSSGNIVVPTTANQLKFTVDGVAKTATIATGAPGAICTTINTAAGGPVASYVPIGNLDQGFFVLKSPTTPAAWPAGLDDVSSLVVNQGTAEGLLGFKSFAAANGTTGALNKAATILGTKAGPFNIVAGQNDTINLRVDGTDYSIILTPGDAVPLNEVIDEFTDEIDGLAVEADGGRVRLISPTNGPTSSLQISEGSANDTLGFTKGSASQTLVSAQEVVGSLMATTAFASGAVAYVSRVNGADYIAIESLDTGATDSSIGFKPASAFRPGTGVNITPGLDGDVGEDAQDNFEVTSSSPAGSAGTGTPGQTYTDARTGLRFTILPATNGSYTEDGYFTLLVSDTFNVSPSVPTYAIGGMEVLVSNTVNVGQGDTANLVTYNPSGVEPVNGDFYSISYRYLKQDYQPQLYRQLKAIEANFGKVSGENRVSMGAYLALLNGAVLVIIKQVPKVANSNQATDADITAAIAELATPLPGNIKPDIIVPLATSTAVQSYLTQHCEVQSNIRNQSERMGFIGFASGTSPTTAQAVAKGLNSNRIVAFYPDSAVVTTTDELGRTSESLVDGSMFAAAVSGSAVSPAVDVATPFTRRRIQGFTRIPRRMDPVEANQTAVAGITLLEDLDPIIRIRHGLTTNMENALTRLPTVTQIADHVAQQSRATLDSFVGAKFLASRINDVTVSLTALFRTLYQSEIVGGFMGINAIQDPDDPTGLRVEATYAPIFPLLYLTIQFNLSSKV